MTAQPEFVPDLEFDLADRMRRAMRMSGLSSERAAGYIGVRRETISSWINGRTRPSRSQIRDWASLTGYPLEWLETGTVPGQVAEDRSKRACRDSNPKPLALEPCRVVEIAPYLARDRRAGDNVHGGDVVELSPVAERQTRSVSAV